MALWWRRQPERSTPEADTWAIEADHPDGGPWLYGRDGVSRDGIVASRLRTDGRYEHAVLDEYGMPIERRTAIRPDLN